MDLWQTAVGQTVQVAQIVTEDEALNAFLRSLGCYPGAPVTVVARRRSGMTVAIRDGRYHMDRQMAEAIGVGEADHKL